MTDDEQRRPATTAATSLGILEQLKPGGPTGPTGLASELELAKSTVHRHLKTLEREGFVVPDDDGYRVGLRLLDFGIYARSQHQLYEVAESKLDELAEQTGEKVWCVTEEQGCGFHLYGAAGAHSVRTPAREGARSYLHQLATGKAILSALPGEHIHDIVDRHGLLVKTPQTITDPGAFFEGLATIRERGFALNREEIIPKLHAISVAVTDNEGRPVGAISILGSSNRLRGDRMTDDLADLLLDATNGVEINLNLSWPGVLSHRRTGATERFELPELIQGVLSRSKPENHAFEELRRRFGCDDHCSNHSNVMWLYSYYTIVD